MLQIARIAMMIESRQAVQLATAAAAIPRERIPPAIIEILCHAATVMPLAASFETMRNDHEFPHIRIGVTQPVEIQEIAVFEL
jgi:hypothetical protein